MEQTEVLVRFQRPLGTLGGLLQQENNYCSLVINESEEVIKRDRALGTLDKYFQASRDKNNPNPVAVLRLASEEQENSWKYRKETY